MEERIRMVMGDILEIDPSRIDFGIKMDTIESWDSVAHINLVTALEEEFGVMFDVAEIETMISYEDIVETLNAKT